MDIHTRYNKGFISMQNTSMDSYQYQIPNTKNQQKKTNITNMKKILFMLATLTIMGCNGNKTVEADNAEEAEDTIENTTEIDEEEEEDEEETEQLQTTTYSNKEKKGIWNYTLKAAYPTGGNKYLVGNIREWINECLGGSYFGDLADIDDLFTYYSKSFLTSQEPYEGGNTEGDGPECTSDYEFAIVWQTDNLITYSCQTYWYGGGAHGGSGFEGQTFRKSDGKKFGKDMLLRNADLQKELNKGLKKYFEVTSDTELEENLQVSDYYSATYLPLPAADPWLDKDGLHLMYGQYEIACYAAGMPEIVIPYSRAKKFLTATIQKEL